MYTKTSIHKVCNYMHNIFNGKIILCGGLVDFFHLGNDTSAIKDFDFCIKISDLIQALDLSNDLIKDIFDTKISFYFKFNDLNLIKYSRFLPDHIACLQGNLLINYKQYQMDIFIVADHTDIEHVQYKQNNLVCNLETPEYRVKHLEWTIDLDPSEYITTRPSSANWFKEKRNKFIKKIARYYEKYPELIGRSDKKFKHRC